MAHYQPAAPVTGSGAAGSSEAAAVLAAAERRAGGRACALVGIDGPSGSGKTTLARAVADQAGAPSVQVDEFWTWGDSGAWWDYLVEAVLVPLAGGQPARYRLRDWDRDLPGRPSGPWTTTPCAPLVVVEGITCTRRPVEGLYALRVWVDAPEDVRRQRGLLRDGGAHRELWASWMQLEAAFFHADGTRARADLCLDSSSPSGDLP